MSECQTGTLGDGGLTEVQRHADKNDQAEPGVEVGDEVDDGNDDVGDGREDAEHDVAVGGGRKKKKKGDSLVKFLYGKTADSLLRKYFKAVFFNVCSFCIAAKFSGKLQLWG